jgi:hypothetical protein
MGKNLTKKLKTDPEEGMNISTGHIQLGELKKGKYTHVVHGIEQGVLMRSTEEPLPVLAKR